MEKRNFALLSFSIVIMLMSMSFASAITGSIGNARAVISPEVGFWGTTIDRTILVKNVNTEAVNVKLETNSSIIEIIDKEFTLEAGSEKNARYKINLKKAGDYTERVNVLFSPFEGKGAGVALPSTIIIHAKAKGDSSDSGNNQNNSDVSASVLSGNAAVSSDNKNTKIPAALIIGTTSTLILLALLISLWILSKKRVKNTRKSKDFRSLKFSQIRDKTRKGKDRSE